MLPSTHPSLARPLPFLGTPSALGAKLSSPLSRSSPRCTPRVGLPPLQSPPAFLSAYPDPYLRPLTGSHPASTFPLSQRVPRTAFPQWPQPSAGALSNLSPPSSAAVPFSDAPLPRGCPLTASALPNQTHVYPPPRLLPSVGSPAARGPLFSRCPISQIARLVGPSPPGGSHTGVSPLPFPPQPPSS